MMYYIESTSVDPTFNLALEQYVFDRLDRQHSYMMLWQNRDAVIIGKYQNTVAEINLPYVKEHGISVVRRLSGGGAVYHDLGNINFTFITDQQSGEVNFSLFCQPVLNALKQEGVSARINGRNDMTIEGKKFSGNSQYMRQGRVMHHGTILYDSDLEAITHVLKVSPDKIETKGCKSVRSRVTNIRPHIASDLTTQEFFAYLKQYLCQTFAMQPYVLTDRELMEVYNLQNSRYRQWGWNFGASPPFRIQKMRRIDGCGKLEVYMDIEKGIIQSLKFYGDFFSQKEPEDLARILLGTRLEENALAERLQNVSIGDYFHRMDLQSFCNVLLQ